jgi:hypothetical protein
LLPDGWFRYTWIQPVLAILLTLVVLYVVGRVTSLVIGRQAFGLFESILERLPFVAKVYTSVRQLLDTMMAKKDASQRVVLMDFPIAGQKSIGFLTRTMTDAGSGQPLAAVLVPNAINPTSAFSADSSHGPRDRNGPDHGTGDEHGDDGRRGGAGDDSVLEGSERCGAGRESDNSPIGIEVKTMQEKNRWQRSTQKATGLNHDPRLALYPRGRAGDGRSL